MRVRTKTDNEAPQFHDTATPQLSGGPARVWHRSTSQNLSSVTTTDVVVAGFKKRSAAGEIFNNPYSRVSSTVVQVPSAWSGRPLRNDLTALNGYKHTLWVPGATGEIFDVSDHNWVEAQSPDTTVNDIDEQRLIDLAVNQAYASVDGSEASALVSLAELTKTIDYIKGTLYQVIRITKAIKRLDLKVLRKEIEFDSIADTYMGLRYGLRPLIIDAEQAIKAYNAKRHVGKRQTARGYAQDSARMSDSRPITYASQKTLIDGSVANHSGKGFTHNVDRSVTVRAGVLYELVALDLPSLKIWGFHDIAGAVLEVIPFSFILGWFMNLADTVAAWQPKAGVNILSSWYTIERHTISATQYMYNDANHDSVTLDGHPYVLIGYYGFNTQQLKVTSSKERIVNPSRAGLSIDINLDIFKLTDMTLILRSILKSS